MSRPPRRHALFTLYTVTQDPRIWAYGELAFRARQEVSRVDAVAGHRGDARQRQQAVDGLQTQAAAPGDAEAMLGRAPGGVEIPS